ncbi:MAG: hypothetical protein P8185_24525 [Deltaproteobacteria bacterium]|jgi:hypothetical protein
MIIFVAVNFKKLLRQKRKYPWPRPDLCPCCRAAKLWGHGFVFAYFDPLPQGVLIRRYRCAQCHCVIRLRPAGYFPRFQAAIKTIYKSLSHWVINGGYLSGICRNRQRHWHKALVRNTAAYLGNRWKSRLLQAFERLLGMGKVPVSSGI